MITKTSLSNIVFTILTGSSETGITVKEALKLAEEAVKANNLTINVNYRAVYQQLKLQGIRLTKGKFVAPITKTIAA
jgi:hypothetical protein